MVLDHIKYIISSKYGVGDISLSSLDIYMDFSNSFLLNKYVKPAVECDISLHRVSANKYMRVFYGRDKHNSFFCWASHMVAQTGCVFYLNDLNIVADVSKRNCDTFCIRKCFICFS